MSLESLTSQSTITVERQVSSRDAGGGISNTWTDHYPSIRGRIEDASAARVEQFARRQINITHEMFTQQAGIGMGMRIKETFVGNAVGLASAAKITTVTGAAIDMNGAPAVFNAAQSISAVSGTAPTLDGKFQERGYDGAFTANTVSGSPIITVVSVPGLAVGDAVAGAGIPALTTILSVSGSRATLSANATATAVGVALTATGTWTDVAGATFAQVGKSAVPVKQTITALRTKRYLRYIGTIGGASPSFTVGVEINPGRYYLVQSLIENRATGGIPYHAEIMCEEIRGRV